MGALVLPVELLWEEGKCIPGTVELEEKCKNQMQYWWVHHSYIRKLGSAPVTPADFQIGPYATVAHVTICSIPAILYHCVESLGWGDNML